MLHSAKALRGFTIAAFDGPLGSIRDVYFDDGQWVIRYFVVDAGDWPSGHDVLLSPISVAAADWPVRALHVKLNRQQIKNSPDIDTAKPVSRQYEEEFNTYYGYPYYWAGPHRGSAVYPGVVERKPLDPAEKLAIRERLGRERAHADPHLRSGNEVIGYRIQASDRQIGHVDDFLFDESDWSIQLVVLATRNWWPGKRVLISPHRIERLSWEDRTVFVNLMHEQIESSPEYDEANPPPGETRHGAHRPRGPDDS